VSFDKILLEKGFEIIGLDPLSECCDFARKELGDSNSVSIIEKGLWTNSGNIDFFPPKNKAHDSWSITNTQSALPQEATTFKVISLIDLIREYPFIGNSDFSMLKLDIEGAESEIMKKLFTSDYKFDFVGIEMDFLSLIPFLAIKRRLRAIINARQNMKIFQSAGYIFVLKENFNFFWIKAIH
jgi:FkbM family methyltransferase